MGKRNKSKKVTHEEITLEQVMAELRAACAGYGNQKAFADRHGLTSQYVGQVLSEKRPPSDAVLAALGIERVVTETFRRVTDNEAFRHNGDNFESPRVMTETEGKEWCEQGAEQ